MTRDNAEKALAIFKELDELYKFRTLAEGYYSEATISVDNTAGQVRTLHIKADIAAETVGEMIAAKESDLTSLGFEV